MNKAIREAIANNRELTLLFTTDAAGCKLSFYIRKFMSLLITFVVIEKYRHLF